MEYHLPIEFVKDFQAKYGKEAIIDLKKEIYSKTLARGIAPSCELGMETLAKYNVGCVPERMSSKIVNVYEIVKKAAEKFRMPIPKIVVSNAMMPNAAATGPGPNHGTMLITTGLLVQLKDEEVLSVVGHELGHLQGRDSLFLFALTSAEFLLRFFVLLPIFLISPFIYIMVAMGGVYFVSKFFEARADLLSAINIGQPKMLAGALEKIGFLKIAYEQVKAYRLQSWMIWDPHPPTYFRVNRLRGLVTPVRVKHPLIRSAKDVVHGFRALFN
ncbi:MAG TPA: M56 family metallopeptidase [Candidatus Bathyarchaeia archaeon]|nr:M56 family metallopeptidase [Candidatus Bathyarchaeia archaeon]